MVREIQTETLFVSYSNYCYKKLIKLENSENLSHLDSHCLQMYVQIYLMSEVT